MWPLGTKQKENLTMKSIKQPSAVSLAARLFAGAALACAVGTAQAEKLQVKIDYVMPGERH